MEILKRVTVLMAPAVFALGGFVIWYYIEDPFLKRAINNRTFKQQIYLDGKELAKVIGRIQKGGQGGRY